MTPEEILKFAKSQSRRYYFRYGIDLQEMESEFCYRLFKANRKRKLSRKDDVNLLHRICRFSF